MFKSYEVVEANNNKFDFKNIVAQRYWACFSATHVYFDGWWEKKTRWKFGSHNEPKKVVSEVEPATMLSLALARDIHIECSK